MNIMRTTVGINKAEDAGRKNAPIGFADAWWRVLPTALARLSRISWLDPPGCFVRPYFGVISE